ncbi:hypothetical protein V5E97_24865 [Singulisphaera sp. Ch08]|uniref:Uncharacterized protein n=1 Tax=Singulisphaera sp. Ch08 TaxID=3120278 RepID=A0AAU7C8V8_9BACT
MDILRTIDTGPKPGPSNHSLLAGLVAMLLVLALAILLYPAWAEHQFQSRVVSLNREAGESIKADDYVNAMACQMLVLKLYADRGKPVEGEAKRCVELAKEQVPILQGILAEDD